MSNYDDVLDQLYDFGLRPELPLETGRMVRCRIDEGKEKKGWFAIHEIKKPGNEILYIGSFGIWSGNDDGLQKIKLGKNDVLSAEEKKAFDKRMAADRKKAAAYGKKRAESAAKRAEAVWLNSSEDGEHEYLQRKNIQTYGARFTKKGELVIPMQDATGKIHGLQLILDRVKHKEQLKNNGRDKHYWPPGVIKKGHFYLIGSPTTILLVAEGFATAASLHAATGLPVAIAFDANNLMPVCEALKKRYPGLILLVCADDDSFSKCSHCKEPVNVNVSADCPHCEKPHGKKNTGVEVASLVAMSLNCYWVSPEFSDPAAIFEHFCKNKGKLTDFNDLHLTDGLHSVRTQIDNAIDRFKLRGRLISADKNNQGGGESKKLVPIDSIYEVMERFVLIYGEGGIVFDRKFRIIIKLTDLADACTAREIYRRWNESSDKQMVLLKEVGFDPTSNDKAIKCNLWDKWPTKPKKGKCELLIELLEYMCAKCNDDGETYRWILKWLAYPLQHPGGKMKSCIVVHGPQGTGKSLFFEAYKSIYGEYGRIIGQAEIESQFTDWISKKLILIADEVVSRTEKYHLKNKLKGMITGSKVSVNQKNKIIYEEKNQVNFIFLSNEDIPVVLEDDDRRHAVVWTPEKLSAQFYKDVGEEIKNGGIAALHDYLLNLDLGEFDEYSQPPMTEAKRDLINLSRDNVLRFYDDWINKELDEIPLIPVLSLKLYELYLMWCKNEGVRSASQNKMIHVFAKRPGVEKKRIKYLDGMKIRQKRFIVPPGCDEKPPGDSNTAWLGECVNKFNNAVEGYKD